MSGPRGRRRWILTTQGRCPSTTP